MLWLLIRFYLKKMDIKISVIVPTYKRPALLKKCIDALLQQEFPQHEYEIVIVTDGPDEESQQIVNNEYRNYTGYKINLLWLRKKKGPAAARNAGWKRAGGELIVFTDDDCVPDKKWLSAYWEKYIEFGRINREIRSENQETMKNLVAFSGKVYVPLSKHPTDYEKNLARLQEAEFVTANCACTKPALEKVNGFDELFTMAWREDSDLHFKLLEANIPVLPAEEALVVHPIRDTAWGVSLKEQKKSMFNALLYKKHPGLYKQKISESPLWNYYAMIYFLIVALMSIPFKLKTVYLIALIGWLALLADFINKRLTGTSRSPKHIAEMIVTSSFIPFLSVYWTLYGSFKFKKLLL
jgi:glycosyltransferase involved in cell wall biosynthesis